MTVEVVGLGHLPLAPKLSTGFPLSFWVDGMEVFATHRGPNAPTQSPPTVFVLPLPSFRGSY